MFKKIYIEITNSCNLNCSFCIGNTRKVEYMSINNFKIILEKLKKYTNYLYFHILGEPLMHPSIIEMINIASKDFYINITTNGYLIKKIYGNKLIRQINVSLHSYNELNKKSLDDYLNDIFLVADSLDNTYINYRMWIDSKYKDRILKRLEEKYNTKINGNTKLKENVFIEFANEFIWPDLNNNLNVVNETCYGTIDHLGILVDGTIVPCCLDSKGIINLGNIFKCYIEDIINTTLFKRIKEGFKHNQRCEKLCTHCGFRVNKTETL